MDLLPPELLLEIFDKLNDNSLRSASEVSKKWLQLIQESPSIMKRFTLYIVIAHNQDFSVFSKIVNGNYQNIAIRNKSKDDKLSPEFNEYLAKHKTTVNNVTLQDFMFSHFISTIYTFDLEKITNLSLIDCHLNNDKGNLIQMPNLTHLELNNSTEFLKFVKIHDVTVLKISNHGNDIIAEHLNSFLETCDSLKELTLSNIKNHSTSLTLKIDKFKFNLMSLTVEGSIISNLQQFLLSQKNSLKNLAIHSGTHSVELLKTIFSDMSLKELEINVENVPQHFQSIAENSTIRKLTARHAPQNHLLILQAAYFQQILREEEDQQLQYLDRMRLCMSINAIFHQNSFEKAEKIISICSAVEEISINDYDLTKYDFLTSMLNLKVLKLSSVKSVISPVIQFDKLTHLEIDSVAYELHIQNLIFFVISSPNLKILKINKVTTDDLNVKYFTEIINKAEKLEEFYIGNGFVFTSKMCKAVRDAKNLGHPLRKLMYTKTLHTKQTLDNDNMSFSLCNEPEIFFSPMANKCKLGKMERDVEKRERMLNESKQYFLHKCSHKR